MMVNSWLKKYKLRSKVKQIKKQIKIKNKKNMVSNNSLVAGTKLRVTLVTSGHGSPIGTVLTFKCYNNGMYVVVNETHWNYGLNDLELVEYTLEMLEEEVKVAEDSVIDAQANVENLKNKIQYLKEIGGSNFNENEYKAYNTLKTLENTDLSILQKAKQIASLFNN